jgi:YVTN family beta-propeller protein
MGAGPYLYVPNAGDNTTSVIDTSTDTVVATIPVGGDTAAISPNGELVYVANESGVVFRHRDSEQLGCCHHTGR